MLHHRVMEAIRRLTNIQVSFLTFPFLPLHLLTFAFYLYRTKHNPVWCNATGLKRNTFIRCERFKLYSHRIYSCTNMQISFCTFYDSFSSYSGKLFSPSLPYSQELFFSKSLLHVFFVSFVIFSFIFSPSFFILGHSQ